MSRLGGDSGEEHASALPTPSVSPSAGHKLFPPEEQHWHSTTSVTRCTRFARERPTRPGDSKLRGTMAGTGCGATTHKSRRGFAGSAGPWASANVSPSVFKVLACAEGERRESELSPAGLPWVWSPEGLPSWDSVSGRVRSMFLCPSLLLHNPQGRQRPMAGRQPVQPQQIHSGPGWGPGVLAWRLCAPSVCSGFPGTQDSVSRPFLTHPASPWSPSVF